jgi:hypothetical protein
MSFDPLKLPFEDSKSIKTPTPKVGAHLGVCGVHSLTLFYTPRSRNVSPKLHSWPIALQALALVGPKARVVTLNHNQNPYARIPFMNWQNQLPNPSTTSQKALQLSYIGIDKLQEMRFKSFFG